jgi:hypothetical protein
VAQSFVNERGTVMVTGGMEGRIATIRDKRIPRKVANRQTSEKEKRRSRTMERSKVHNLKHVN